MNDSSQDTEDMYVVADENACCGSGQCVVAAPDVFDQRDEDGIVTVLQSRPPESLREAVAVAVGACPAQALAWANAPSGSTTRSQDAASRTFTGGAP